LREYLACDLFVESTTFPYDFERIVDDFVFICFFVGNDFIPHLPTLEIREGAIDLLMDIYKKTLPVLGGYLSNEGVVDFEKVHLLLSELSPLENLILKDRRQKDEKWKKNRKENESKLLEMMKIKNSTEIFMDIDEVNKNEAKLLREQLNCIVPINRMEQKLLDEQKPPTPQTKIKDAVKVKFQELEKEDEDIIQYGEEGWRDRYYKRKFNVNLTDEEFFQKINKSYGEGLQWVLYYYYQGCKDWGWYYPYHYAPFSAEVNELNKLKVQFDPNSLPYNPIEQLMAVLPAASSTFLPVVCRELMVRVDSPIIDFYPENFEIDMEGKKFAWQGIPLLPFINEELLLKTIRSSTVNEKFNDDEKYRNRRGHDIIFVRNDHPSISKYFQSLEKAKENNEEAKIELETEIFGSISNTGDFVISGPSIKSNVPGVEDVHGNKALCARYYLPNIPNDYIFKAKLLKGLVYPASVLTQDDLFKRRQHTNVHKFLRELEEYKGGPGPIESRYQRKQDRQYQPYDRRKSYPESGHSRGGYRGNNYDNRNDNRFDGNRNNNYDNNRFDGNRNNNYDNNRFSENQNFRGGYRDNRNNNYENRYDGNRNNNYDNRNNRNYNYDNQNRNNNPQNFQNRNNRYNNNNDNQMNINQQFQQSIPQPQTQDVPKYFQPIPFFNQIQPIPQVIPNNINNNNIPRRYSLEDKNQKN
jgi:5'-3' exoribonuclease 2